MGCGSLPTPTPLPEAQLTETKAHPPLGRPCRCPFRVSTKPVPGTGRVWRSSINEHHPNPTGLGQHVLFIKGLLGFRGCWDEQKQVTCLNCSWMLWNDACSATGVDTRSAKKENKRAQVGTTVARLSITLKNISIVPKDSR